MRTIGLALAVVQTRPTSGRLPQSSTAKPFGWYLSRQAGAEADYVAGLYAAALARMHEHVRRAYARRRTGRPRSDAATAWAVRGLVPA